MGRVALPLARSGEPGAVWARRPSRLGKARSVDVPRQHPCITVIGIGNDFRRDDAAGRVVVTALARRGERRPLPPGTRLLVCDGEPARLLSLWQNTDLTIVVDAARAASGRPGRIRRLDGDAVLRMARRDGAGSHGLGLRAAVELAGALELLPGCLVVYTVQTADTAPGMRMSPEVRAAVRPLVRRVADEITRYALSAAP